MFEQNGYLLANIKSVFLNALWPKLILKMNATWYFMYVFIECAVFIQKWYCVMKNKKDS